MNKHIRNLDAGTDYDLGVVYKKSSGFYAVYSGDRSLTCTLALAARKGAGAAKRRTHPERRGRQADASFGPVEPPAVGDVVRFVDDGGGAGRIVSVLPRRTQLSRRSAVPMPTAHASEQVIAANVDLVVPVFSAANPAPKWNLLDRTLVSTEAAGLEALICITKLDLVRAPGGSLDPDLDEAVAEYRRIGYAVALVSAVTGEGMAELATTLEGRVSVLVGKSGVGKTSLLNALQPGLGGRVGQVRRGDGKGRHTTTSLEMFPLRPEAPVVGGGVIDTPGVREFGLWEVAVDDLAGFFPEMRPYLGRCRFGLDCAHDEEPGCAVRQAVTSGQLSPRRYLSYLRLRMEQSN